jgi:hypothetical protein
VDAEVYDFMTFGGEVGADVLLEGEAGVVGGDYEFHLKSRDQGTGNKEQPKCYSLFAVNLLAQQGFCVGGYVVGGEAEFFEDGAAGGGCAEAVEADDCAFATG